jgi:beta-ribofuranosylaminobenzene 5'-phosphate synthase
MGKHCTVTTGARLHFGPLAWRPEKGRDFGGWGIMVDTPSLVVEVSDQPREQDRFPIDVIALARAENFLREFQKTALRERSPVELAITKLHALPAHSGLGSGTQLALAVGTAAAQILDGTRWPAEKTAPYLQRGLRSAVGVHGFDFGGLIVDAGKHREDLVGRLAARVSVPDEWRFVLLMPQNSGMAGDAEIAAFQRLTPYPEGLSDRLSRLILTEVLPAVNSRDFNGFAGALDEYGRLVGEAFQDVQGGIVHPASRPWWEHLARKGVTGAAQTSWGPTLAVACPSTESARHVVEQLELDDASSSRGQVACQALIAAPRNVGAEIHVSP